MNRFPTEGSAPVVQIPGPAPAAHVPLYSLADTVYAWLSLLFAFLFCQALPAEDHPLGVFLLVAALFVTGFVFARIKQLRLSPVCILCAAVCILAASAAILTDTALLMRLCLLFSLCGYLYFLYAAHGNTVEEGLSDLVFMDFIKLLFILPFPCFGCLFPALSQKSSRRTSLTLLKILIGIGITIIPTLIVFAYLSYDAGFVKLLKNIFTFDAEQLARTVLSLLFTPPLAMYGFGLYTASRRKVLHGAMSAENCKKAVQKAQILPSLTAVVAVLPILFLYVIFFLSQWQYYVSGFTGVLPASFSYAEYARRGFFELAAVSAINLLLIVGITFFLRRDKRGSRLVLRLVSSVFCLFTLILISTAVAKLLMYIDCYGLTQKRVYAMWLMVLIGIVFLLVALGQFLPRLKAPSLCLIVFAVLFLTLSLSNVSALCAKYNADQYLAGELETLDLAAMKELGDSAVPSLVRVAEEMDAKEDPELKQGLDSLLQNAAKKQAEEQTSVFGFSLPRALARSALARYTQNG